MFIAIIPARYASTRFPGKPLARLGGITVIERVYRAVKDTVDYALVATDDQRIYDAVRAFGGNVVMTSSEHHSGTDRVEEAYTTWKAANGAADSDDVVINVQGDEPFIRPEQIATVKACFNDPTTQIATLVKPFSSSDGWEAVENPNSPKVVVDKAGYAVYFSRSVIPYVRGAERGEAWLAHHQYFKHIGLYAYRASVLAEITRLPQSALELAESLEQLRWIENGYKIRVGQTDIETVGIDTPQDLERAEAVLKNSDQR